MTHSRLTCWISAALIAGTASFTSPVTAASAKPPRPNLKLTVSTHSGLYPLDLILGGFIKDADLMAFESCLITVEWAERTPGKQELLSKKEVPCLQATSDKTVPESFKITLTLDEPGYYSFRLVLVSKAGKRYASASQEVRAIRSTFAVGGTAIRTDDR